MVTKKIIAHLQQDPIMEKVIQTTPPLPEISGGEVYPYLVRSITSQQLSVKAAATIHGRFLDLFEEKYPHPEILSELDTEVLRSVGLSYQKAAYVKNVAQYFLENQDESWDKLTDGEIIQKLTTIKGVGKWTVEMVLMFALKRPDVFPIDDLGIRQAMIELYDVQLEKKALYQKLEEIAAPWGPYRTIACRYLWHWKG
ncbi:MAG: DNA-3-methyladenine glycosylase 2 family protein [Saprospiraceae bacterium]|nr:DNA-3-methyladenine glycosylase 2 family protein [Saprospiraceae bacterium]